MAAPWARFSLGKFAKSVKLSGCCFRRDVATLRFVPECSGARLAMGQIGVARGRSCLGPETTLRGYCQLRNVLAEPSAREILLSGEGRVRGNEHLNRRQYSHTPPVQVLVTALSDLQYEQVAEETLESLSTTLEELGDSQPDDFDVNYSSGVLTLSLGAARGIYVINKQTPNKQIWFSSPLSGPKRYDYVGGRWVYKYDNLSLHELLTAELSRLLDIQRDLTACAHGRPSSTQGNPA